MNILVLLADLSTQTILLSGISALGVAIAALVLYIKSLHKAQVDMTEKFTQTTASLTKSIDGLKDNMKENTDVMQNVHDRILTAFKPQ